MSNLQKEFAPSEALSKSEHHPLIVSGFDDAYVWPFLIHMFSGRQSSKVIVSRHVAYTPSSLSLQSRQLIEDVAKWLGVTINWVQIGLPANLPLAYHLPPMTYARLVLADELLTPFYWLDVDTLLLSGWDEIVSLQEIPVGCVSSAVLECWGNSSAVSHQNEAFLIAGDNYFNSGVMRIDPRAWRSGLLDSKWKNLLVDYQSYNFQFADQDILNFILVGANEVIPKQFNFMPQFWGDVSFKPSIVHYTSPNKPWLVSKLERTPPFRIRFGAAHTHWFKTYWNAEKEFMRRIGEEAPDLTIQIKAIQTATRRSFFSPQRISRIVKRHLPWKPQS